MSPSLGRLPLVLFRTSEAAVRDGTLKRSAPKRSLLVQEKLKPFSMSMCSLASLSPLS